MSDKEDDKAKDPHAEAAANAAKGAGAAAGGGSSHDPLTAQLLGVKRTIASTPHLQADLNLATTERDFHDRLVAIGARLGVHFTPDQGKAFLARRAHLLGHDPEPPPMPQSVSNCGPGTYTHNSGNWCTFNVVKCPHN